MARPIDPKSLPPHDPLEVPAHFNPRVAALCGAIGVLTSNPVLGGHVLEGRLVEGPRVVGRCARCGVGVSLDS